MESALVGEAPTTLYRASVERLESSEGAVEVLDCTILYDTVQGASGAGEVLLSLYREK